MADNKCHRQLDLRVQKSIHDWKLENSEIIILTDAGEQDELRYLGKLAGERLTMLDRQFVDGNWIEIMPVDLDVSAELQTPAPETRSRLIGYQIITLHNGNRAAYRTLGDLLHSALVPHNVSVRLSSGKTVRSIDFVAAFQPGSAAEVSFYDILKSLRSF